MTIVDAQIRVRRHRPRGTAPNPPPPPPRPTPSPSSSLEARVAADPAPLPRRRPVTAPPAPCTSATTAATLAKRVRLAGARRRARSRGRRQHGPRRPRPRRRPPPQRPGRCSLEQRAVGLRARPGPIITHPRRPGPRTSSCCRCPLSSGRGTGAQPHGQGRDRRHRLARAHGRLMLTDPVTRPPTTSSGGPLRTRSVMTAVAPRRHPDPRPAVHRARRDPCSLEPEALRPRRVGTLGTDGNQMSTSRGNVLGLRASTDRTAALIRLSAGRTATASPSPPTDRRPPPPPRITSDPAARPEVANLLELAGLLPRPNAPARWPSRTTTGGAAGSRAQITDAVNEFAGCGPAARSSPSTSARAPRTPVVPPDMTLPPHGGRARRGLPRGIDHPNLPPSRRRSSISSARRWAWPRAQPGPDRLERAPPGSAQPRAMSTKRL